MTWLSTVWRDLGFAARAAVDRPGFAMTVIGTLALAIAANTAVFSLLNGILLNQLPFHEPDRVVVITMRTTDADQRQAGVSPGDARTLIEQSQEVGVVGVYSWGGMALGGSDRPRDIANNQVSPGYFEALGVQPALGSGFSFVEGTKEAILSNSLWLESFGGRDDVIGEQALFDNEPYTIVGVMPRHMDYPSGSVGFWIPGNSELNPTLRTARYMSAVARLAPGSTIASFRAEAESIAAELARDFPDSNENWTFAVESLEENVVGDVRQSLWILMAIVVLLMMIACANVANAMLSRGLDRQRELALRAAVGASSPRLASLLLTESLFLSILGAAVGLILAFAAVDALGLLASLELPRLDEVTINGPVVLFNLVLALLAALGCGLLPALKISRTAPIVALRSGGKGVSGSGPSMWQKSFAVAAVALSMVLLVVSGVLIESFMALQRVEIGFDPDKTVSAQLWRNAPRPERLAYFDEVLDTMNADPQIRAAAGTNYLPLDYIGGWSREIKVVGREEAEADAPLMVNFAGDIAEVFKISVLAGDYPSHDSGQHHLWINREGAERYFGSIEAALGNQVEYPISTDEEPEIRQMTIAGVIGDIYYQSIETPPGPTLLIPVEHWPTINMNFVARGSASTSELMDAALNALWSVDPSQPIYRDIYNADLVDAQIADERVYLQLVLIFAFVALALACVGVYAVIAYSVGRRQAEFGLRTAVGASRKRILQLVLSESARHVVVGLIIGLGLAMLLVRWLQGELYAVEAIHPEAMLVASVLLALVAAMATWVPANRATRVDPIIALRCD